MVDTVVRFLREVPTTPTAVGVPLPLHRNAKVAYALANRLGSILLVYENRFLVRKANISNHADIRLNAPLDYLNSLSAEPTVTIDIGPEATVFLMYCHRVAERLKSHCRQLVLLGPSAIVFADHLTVTEEAQAEHRKRCRCGHICYSRPPTLPLKHGGRLTIKKGNFYVSVSAEQHSVYMNKREFIEQTSYASEGGVAEAWDFVNSLPDEPEPLIS